MSAPVGALASKSRLITASNCSNVSNTEKSRSGQKLAGNTRRPSRLTTKASIALLLRRPRRPWIALPAYRYKSRLMLGGPIKGAWGGNLFPPHRRLGACAGGPRWGSWCEQSDVQRCPSTTQAPLLARAARLRRGPRAGDHQPPRPPAAGRTRAVEAPAGGARRSFGTRFGHRAGCDAGGDGRAADGRL